MSLRSSNLTHLCGECGTDFTYGYFLDGNASCYDCYQANLDPLDDDYDPDHESHSEEENNAE